MVNEFYNVIEVGMQSRIRSCAALLIIAGNKERTLMKTKKQIIIIALTLLISIASVSLVAAMIIPSAEELLTQSLETMETIKDGHAIVEVTMETPVETRNGTFEVWTKFSEEPEGRPSLRLEVLEASKAELVGVTAVSDGDQSWLYDPNRDIVIVGRAEEIAPLIAEKMAGFEGLWQHDSNFDPENADLPKTPAEVVAKLLEHYTAERNGQEQIAGSDADKLRLVPIPEQMPDELRAAGGFINLWLRTNDQLPLAMEYAEGAIGYGKIQASIAEINTGLDASIFTFVIPDSTEVIQATELLANWEPTELPADFEVLTPTTLPEGAVQAGTQQIAGSIVQRFNLPDGLSFFVAQGIAMPLDPPAEASISETVIVRGVEAISYTNDTATRSLLSWIEEDNSFLIGGDLTPEQAVAIAESLQ